MIYITSMNCNDCLYQNHMNNQVVSVIRSYILSGVQHSIHVLGKHNQLQYIIDSSLLLIMSANTNCQCT